MHLQSTCLFSCIHICLQLSTHARICVHMQVSQMGRRNLLLLRTSAHLSLPGRPVGPVRTAWARLDCLDRHVWPGSACMACRLPQATKLSAGAGPRCFRLARTPAWFVAWPVENPGRNPPPALPRTSALTRQSRDTLRIRARRRGRPGK